ncbi:peptide chain release factor N(5)-glutamine methyltransferase [Corynebacterium mayonis]|uniref:peptide chain release factor N(5)-glutamine methyltransferase n=1 Tax=Corynebacterium mayonis TaxID=3062461 RepID=UPI0031409686
MKRNNLREMIARAAEELAGAGVATPEVDARLIAAWLLDVPPTQLIFAKPSPTFADDYVSAIARRAQREPLQHITGRAAFGPLELRVGPGVFIPRPETEVLGQWAVEAIEDVAEPVVVDLGTGTGALALFIAHHRPDAHVTAVELSAKARAYAEDNVRAHGARLTVVAGDMTDPGLLAQLRGTVDLVVSNPPYVPEDPNLSAEVYFDPSEAVFSGGDGMDAIRGLVPVAAGLLKPGGAIGIEHDDTTSGAVREVLLADARFTAVQAVKDLADRDRFVTASKVEG